MGPKARTIKFYSTVSDRSEVIHLISRLFSTDGGPGSGNFGHKGRPGKVGGSGAGGGSGKGSGGQQSAASQPNIITSSETHSEPKGQESETFNIFEFLGKEDEEEAKRNENAYEESARKSVEALKQSFHMQGVVNAAREAKGDYRAFVKNMTDGQKDALRQQYNASGTKEKFTDYIRRMQGMLANEKDPPPLTNKLVDGKDIALSYEYKGTSDTPKDGSEAIDTVIEDVIHQQGFDGVPKVVNQEEFDKILMEHPEMPILMRSYAAPSAEVLQTYDKQLESGFWYVDCGTGGAQYGQGMYAAGVYNHGARDVTDARAMIDWRNHYATDKFGRIYDVRGLETFYPSSVENMENGDKFVLIHEDTSNAANSRSILVEAVELNDDEIGNFGVQLVNVNTGEILSDDEIKTFDEVRDVYDEITPEAMYKEQLSGAMSEMKHYRKLGENRCKDQSIQQRNGNGITSGLKFDPQEAYEQSVWSDDNKLYKPVGDVMEYNPGELSPGESAILYVKYDENSDDRTVFYVKMTDDGTLDFGNGMNNDRLNMMTYSKPVEMRKTEVIDDKTPVSTTRMMTLDPSAKIIDYSQLVEINEGYLSEKEIDRMADEWFEKEVDLSKYEPDERDYIRFVYSETLNNQEEPYEVYAPKYQAVASKLPEETQQFLYRKAQHMRSQFENSEALFNARHDAAERGKEYRRKFRDIGALAAALGYDAINAEGHGITNSYTVVLNRTKVILSDKHVDAA